jgi:hypothetical protein
MLLGSPSPTSSNYGMRTMHPYLHRSLMFKTAGKAPPVVSGASLEQALKEVSGRGQQYVGIGGGVLGALLGGGLGALTSPKGRKLRNALIGAGIGGGAGGAAGYFLSPHVSVPFMGGSYEDKDTKTWYRGGDVKTRGMSLAEVVGALTGSPLALTDFNEGNKE